MASEQVQGEQLDSAHLDTCAQLECIDARLCRTERGQSRRPLAPPAGGARTHIVVRVGARATELLDLPAELLALTAARLPADDEFAAALTCCKLRHAIMAGKQRTPRGRLSTSIGSAFESLPRLTWAVSCGLPLSSDLLRRAARRGHLDQLSWLRAQGCAWGPCVSEDDNSCAEAALGGHLTVLQWARADGCPWSEWTCTAAAVNGDLAILQWARAHGCPWNPNACRGAAENGHLAVLQWLRANGCPWNTWTCFAAAHNNHLPLLQWGHAKGCPWDGDTCFAAAKNGHLPLLAWARAHSCPWDACTCAYAAEDGHLAVLQWARAHGCPWDEHVCA
jgi:hypothetical protein